MTLMWYFYVIMQSAYKKFLVPWLELIFEIINSINYKYTEFEFSVIYCFFKLQIQSNNWCSCGGYKVNSLK